jgi:hypothetical protein
MHRVCGPVAALRLRRGTSLTTTRSRGDLYRRPQRRSRLRRQIPAVQDSREAEALARRRKQDQFLPAFSTHATISGAAKATNVGRRTHHLWLETDKNSGLSVRTLRNLLVDPMDPLPHFKLPGKILVTKSEFDAWIERRRVQTDDRPNLGAVVDDIVAGFR